MGPHSASPKRGQSPSPIFGPFILLPNGWMHQDATWYRGGPQTRGLCVRWGQLAFISQKLSCVAALWFLFPSFYLLSFPCLISAWHSSSGRHPNFAALNSGRYLYSAGWPSRCTLAHILVLFTVLCTVNSACEIYQNTMANR